MDFAARAARDLLIGRNPWNRPDLWSSIGGAPVVELMGKTVPDRLARFFSSMIEENYAIIAANSGKPARFFAEKSVLQEPVRVAYRVLFPNVKEIVLVRDPRDYLCSARTFWKHHASEVIATQASEMPILSKIYKENRADVKFIRYEDLILDAAATRRKIYEFIGCDPDFRAHEIAADVVPATHRTSSSATASIGRFKAELDETTLSRCNEAFGPFLALFDYAR